MLTLNFFLKESDFKAFFQDTHSDEESEFDLRRSVLRCTIIEKEELNVIVGFVEMEPLMQTDGRGLPVQEMNWERQLTQ